MTMFIVTNRMYAAFLADREGKEYPKVWPGEPNKAVSGIELWEALDFLEWAHKVSKGKVNFYLPHLEEIGQWNLLGSYWARGGKVYRSPCLPVGNEYAETPSEKISLVAVGEWPRNFWRDKIDSEIESLFQEKNRLQIKIDCLIAERDGL